MKVRIFWGLVKHPLNWTIMRMEVKPGDTVTYIDRGLYRDRHDVRTERVGYVPGIDTSVEWFMTTDDDAIMWDDVLEWTPK